ncbi:hypothetical protein UlMin_031021 [Ulmus minor]
MGEIERELKCIEKEEEERAKLESLKLGFGFTEMAVVKCAIELQIADTIESNGNPMTLSELSSALGCAPSFLHRIMRFLVQKGIFKEIDTIPKGSKAYAQTLFSRRLMRSGDTSMAALVLLESSPVMLAPWHNLSARVLSNGASSTPPFEAAHGENVWSYAAANPAHSQLINEAMACLARVSVIAIIDGCLDVFNGIETLIDVGGGNGTALSMYVKACPWIQGINFDLPHVVSVAPKWEGVEHVGGDMFVSVPKADAAYLMLVLHDWGDDECIHILKKCREAIPKEKGKVIIVEAVIEQEQVPRKEKLSDVGLILDMVMMAHTNKGKERTLEEWGYVLREAGFSRHSIRSIAAVSSVIEAFP